MNGTWSVLAELLTYPSADRRGEIRAALAAIAGAAGVRSIAEFLDATDGMALEDLQELYTAAFDFDPACALDVGWHLFGESRERGAFLALLREDLQRAGITESAGLPDHVTHVLALIARDAEARAAALARFVMPATSEIERGLAARESPYVHALAAVNAELAALVARQPAQR